MNYVSGKIVDLPVGNTERAAQMLRLFTGGDLFHIRTASVYPNDYQEVVKIAKKEKADNARPVLERDIDSIDDYDVIFLGYPNWCGTMPMALWTFLESHDFTDKTIYPFCTHEGSGVGHSWKTSTLSARRPNSARAWPSWYDHRRCRRRYPPLAERLVARGSWFVVRRAARRLQSAKPP